MRAWIKVIIGLFVGCQLSCAAEETKTDVKLLLSPTDRMPFESRPWGFTLVREGFPVSVTNDEEKKGRLFYRDSNPGLGVREGIVFTGVRPGRFTLLAAADKGVGETQFTVAEVDVQRRQNLVLDPPPIFSIKVTLAGEEVVKENASFFLRITGVDRPRSYYRNDIPMGEEHGDIVGEWDFLFVPRKYKLVLVQYGRVGEQPPYHFEKEFGTVDITADDVIKGTLTLDAKKHPWRDTSAKPARTK